LLHPVCACVHYSQNENTQIVSVIELFTYLFAVIAANNNTDRGFCMHNLTVKIVVMLLIIFYVFSDS